MRDKKQKQKEKSQKLFKKFVEKQEHIENLNKALEKQRKKLENKIIKKEENQKIFDRKKELYYNQKRKARNELFKKIQSNKKQLERIEFLRREDILFEENNKIGRLYSPDIGRQTCMSNLHNIQSKTLIISKEDYELRKEFLRKMNQLKSESVSNKSYKERRRLYLNKLRAEAEKRRKEEEERLEKLQMG
mgnify:CR=1 FL=1|jgi:hypothetical protein